MYNIKRKAEIISLLEENKEVDVNSLSERFRISKETIRRDLCQLEREGVLTRTHGGAVYNGAGWQTGVSEYPVAVRGIQRYNEKNSISRRAASLLVDGDVIFVDNSSTTMYLPRYIPRDIHIVVLTNSLKLLLEGLKNQNNNIQYICFGGNFREANLSFYGNSALKNASEYFPTKAFISCTGLRDRGVITDASMQEVDVKRLMIERSQRVYLLADHTKFVKSGQVFIANLNRSHTVITDTATSREHQEYVTSLGAELIVAPAKGGRKRDEEGDPYDDEF